MERNKKCLVCETEFTAKSNKANYCSDACRLTAFRQREKQKNIDKINEIQYSTVKPKSDYCNEPKTNEQISNIEQQIAEIIFYSGSTFLHKNFLDEFRDYKNDTLNKINGLLNEVESLKSENKEMRSEIERFKNSVHDYLFQIKGMKLDIENSKSKEPNGTEIAANIFSGLVQRFV